MIGLRVDGADDLYKGMCIEDKKAQEPTCKTIGLGVEELRKLLSMRV